MTNSVTAVEAREKFSDILNRAAYAKERIFIRRHGNNIAAIVPMTDVENLEKAGFIAPNSESESIG